MHVTVTEAMRVKNQVSLKVQQIQSQVHQLQYGMTSEGQDVIGSDNVAKFQDFLVAIADIYQIKIGRAHV